MTEPEMNEGSPQGTLSIAEARAVVERAEATKRKQSLAQRRRQEKVRRARALLEKSGGVK